MSLFRIDRFLKSFAPVKRTAHLHHELINVDC
jgi:hypothetical protein